MVRKKSHSADWESLLAEVSYGKTVTETERKRHVFRQGDPADAVFFLQPRQGEAGGYVQTRQRSHCGYSGPW